MLLLHPLNSIPLAPIKKRVLLFTTKPVAGSKHILTFFTADTGISYIFFAKFGTVCSVNGFNHINHYVGQQWTNHGMLFAIVLMEIIVVSNYQVIAHHSLHGR